MFLSLNDTFVDSFEIVMFFNIFHNIMERKFGSLLLRMAGSIENHFVVEHVSQILFCVTQKLWKRGHKAPIYGVKRLKVIFQQIGQHQPNVEVQSFVIMLQEPGFDVGRPSYFYSLVSSLETFG